jgi:hypothetical protein
LTEGERERERERERESMTVGGEDEAALNCEARLLEIAGSKQVAG